MTRRTTPPPQNDPDIARLAAALADASRVAMLDALLDGKAHAIGALARHAGITAATASGHLRRLGEEKLVVVNREGREHLVRLAHPGVAHLLETMSALASPSSPRTSGSSTRARELRFARTCYDHLAGVLGVRVTGALLDRQWLLVRDESFVPAPDLFEWLATHARPFAMDDRSRRPVTRSCLDWSERSPHLAGRLGAAVADLFLSERWVVRARESRALHVTDRGRAALEKELALTL